LKLIKSIQFQLKKANYIVWVTDKSGIFHLENSIDYEQKAEAYWQNTGAYIELESDSLWIVFDKLFICWIVYVQKIIFEHGNSIKWCQKKDKVAWAYLYFISNPHKVNNVLRFISTVLIGRYTIRPIISSMNTSTTGISKFLDQIIRPLFDKHVCSTTIIDSIDLIRRLETYVENDYLKPTTQLCTFDITDLYTMLP